MIMIFRERDSLAKTTLDVEVVEKESIKILDAKKVDKNGKLLQE